MLGTALCLARFRDSAGSSTLSARRVRAVLTLSWLSRSSFFVEVDFEPHPVEERELQGQPTVATHYPPHCVGDTGWRRNHNLDADWT
jgi:hypothetical protein